MKRAHLFGGRYTGRVVVQYMGPVYIQVGVLPFSIGQACFGEISYKQQKARNYLYSTACFGEISYKRKLEII